MLKRLSTALITAILLLSYVSPAFAGGWMFYMDGPYKGKVLDLETDKPIEGAVVAGIWDVDQYGGIGGVIPAFCDAKEAVTDKNGEFKVPRAFCWHWWPFSSLGDPRFTVFKPGYLGYPPLGATQEERIARMPGFTGEEFRDKSQYYVVKLGRPKTREERVLTHDYANSGLPTDLKDYEKMPNLLMLINEERKNLGYSGEIGPKKGGQK